MAVTERLAIFVEANAGKAIAEFKQLGTASKNLSGEAGKAGGLVAGIGGRLGGLMSAVGPASIAAGFSVAGVAIAKFVDDSVASFMTLAGQVRQVRNVMGGTATDASYLLAAFSAVGVDVDTLSNSMFKLEKSIGAGGTWLAKYGVEVIRDTSGNVNMAKTILSVAAAYERTTDPAQRATLLTAAFGRGGAAMIPLLAKGTEGIKELYAEAERHHLILDDKDLVTAAELKVALRDLKESVHGLQIEAGRGLVPFAADALNLIDKIIARTDQAISGPKPDGPGGIWAGLTKYTHNYLQAIGDVVTALPGADAALKNTGAAAGATTEEIATLGTAVSGMVTADRSLAASQRSLSEARGGQIKDFGDYLKLLKEGAVDAQKVADAQRSLADATRSVGHAQREQADAQAAYDAAAAAAAILGTDTSMTKKHDAANDLADANDNVTSALERQTTAAAALATAKAGDPDYQEKLAAAKKKVADDTQHIADAEYNVAQNSLASVGAHNAERDALAGKADVAERLIADYQQLIALHPEVGPALAPSITAIQGALGLPPPNLSPLLPVAPTAAGGGGLLGGGGGGILGDKAVTQNITVNTTGPVDADALARSILWGLN